MKILFQTALTDYSSKDLEGVGTIRVEADGKVYRWVENLNASVAFLAGQPVNYDATATLANMFEGAIACAAADEELLAGVAMSAIPAGSYGWIQIKGLSVTARVTNSVSGSAGQNIVIGDALTVVSAATSFTYTAAGGNTAKNGPAIAAEAVSQASATTLTTAAKGVWLNCIG